MNDSKIQVCVIGGASVDIFGIADKKINVFDSNPGKVTYSFGGVGHNIANNLSKLGISVELLCGLGKDMNAKRIMENCRQENIGLNHCYFSELPSATYLCINQPDGDIYAAVADMKIHENISVDYLNEELAFINSCAIAVIDTNLSQEACDFLFENLTCAIYVDPVSVAKAAKVKNYLSEIAVIKPNYPEAKTILNKELPPTALAAEFIRSGVKEVYLTLGAEGAIGVNYKESCQFPVFPGNTLNTTGCGDAFLAGVIYGALKGKDLVTKTNYGLAAAGICSRSLDTVSELLNEEELLKLVEERS